MDNLQEAYLSVYQELDEGFKSPYQSPPAHGRSMQGNPEKGETLGNPARLSPAMRATQKSDQLRATESGSSRERKQTTRARQLQRNFQSARTVGEEVDLFDCILEYLVSEGYADTNENAIAIMANMSEEWKSEILDEMEVQPPREPLKTDRNMFTIPQKERDEARERTLAKAKAMREKKGIK
jgi:hypothetical protein